ncbi:unnamed protein product [Symbiodinium sp. CCMP2592]|nr:unnamed protein product [Symbiodinium sp. CCMP2592]
MSRVLGLGCVLRRHAGRCLAFREVFSSRCFSSSAGTSLRAAEIAASDEFGLTAAACSLIRERDAHGAADFSIWQAISDRAADLVDTASPKHLVWLLAAFSDADFHPDERKRLHFLRAFRARLAESDDWLHRFSNDELCVTWRAFDRLQLLNKKALLQFHRVATEPLEGARCHGAKQTELPPRYSTFSLWNSVLEAEALRDAKRYPASSEIAKSLARQLLVDHEEPLRELGLSLDAIHAVADMAELSSRQKHRITAQLRELLPNLSAQAALVDLPRACARACITDEDFFPEFADCLARFWPMADSRQLIACWRSLMQWRVGPPGLDRCAAAAFCDSHCSAWSLPGLSPGAAVRQLRALGRLGASNLPAEEAREEAEVALLVALRATLLALLAPSAEHSLESRDLLLAMNALGQIARGWDWLGKEVPTDADGAEVPTPLPQLLWESVESLSGLAALQLQLYEVQLRAGFIQGDAYSTRDLALLLLAQGRVARRLRGVAPILPPLSLQLCSRLEQAATEWRSRHSSLDADGISRASSEGSLALAAASMMLMHCKSMSESSDAQGAWRQAASAALRVVRETVGAATDAKLQLDDNLFKALAANAVIGELLFRAADESPLVAELLATVDTLAAYLQSQEFVKQRAHLGAWHLDSCLHLLAVQDALSLNHGGRLSVDLGRFEEAVLEEATRQLPRRKSISFWLRFLELPAGPRGFRARLLAELQEEAGKEESKITGGVAAAVKQCAAETIQDPEQTKDSIDCRFCHKEVLAAHKDFPIAESVGGSKVMTGADDIRVVPAEFDSCADVAFSFTNLLVEDTPPGISIHDITPQVRACVAKHFANRRSHQRDGVVNLISRHTTTAVTINEDEALLRKDIANFLMRMAPPDAEYQHNHLELRPASDKDRAAIDRNWMSQGKGTLEEFMAQEPKNAHSHLLAITIGQSETIPVAGKDRGFEWAKMDATQAFFTNLAIGVVVPGLLLRGAQCPAASLDLVGTIWEYLAQMTFQSQEDFEANVDDIPPPEYVQQRAAEARAGHDFHALASAADASARFRRTTHKFKFGACVRHLGGVFALTSWRQVA